MFKKLLFLLLIISSANAQNTNTAVVQPKPANANAAATPTPRKSPKPVRTPLPNDADYGEPPEVKALEPANTTIRGRVYYEDTGRAVKRASIMLMPKTMGGGPEFSGITDSNGNFQIKNVRVGTYFAMVNAPGVVSPLAYADISQAKGDEGLKQAFINFEPITANGINDLDVQVPAKRGGAISGKIMYADGDAAIGVSVQILRKLDGKFIPVIPNLSSLMMAMMQSGGVYQTDDRGIYRFAGLPEGEYIVKVSENATHSDSKDQGRYGAFEASLFGGNTSFLTMFYPDVFDSEKAQIINLVLGQETTEINLVIPNRELHKIEGKVIAGKDKLPIKNAKITLKRVGDKTTLPFGEERLSQYSTTDDEGKFAFKEIPAGTYRATIVAQNSQFDEKKQIYGSSPYADGYAVNAPAVNSVRYAANSAIAQANQKKTPKFSKKTQEIAIEEKDIEDLKIEMGFGATISGTVKAEIGEEMPTNFTIFALDENDENTATGVIYNGEFEYNEKGRQKRNVFDHTFDLDGVAEGKTKFSFYCGDNDYYVKSATFRNVDLLINPFEVKEGEIVKGLQVVLSKDVGTLKGKVLNAENEPAKNTEITFFPTNAGRRSSRSFTRDIKTDENGEFEIKLPPIEYAAIFIDKRDLKSVKEFQTFIDEAMKDAQKVSIEANKTQTISIKMKK
jgi:Carboxypeptidase regulatory-like domain